jgi:nucleoside-diphosphate-sugar epimerase
MDELTPYQPLGPYHETKAAAERLALKYKDTLPVTIVRPTITYGPGDTDGLVAKIFQLVAKGFFVFVGNGSNHVHLSYVRNIMKGFSVILSKGGSGRTYILADENGITMQNLVDSVSMLLHVSYHKVFLPYRFAKAAMRMYEGASEKIVSTSLPKATVESVDILSRNRYYSIAAARALGYEPESSTIEGLRLSTQWYQSIVKS